MKGSKIISSREAARRLEGRGGEVALVRNPAYVHPAIELCPLAPRITGPVPQLLGAVMDMDGTTTTTEPLCLHSLETMVRRITNRPTRADWPGLDREADYPHVIGNSTTRHVEYLVNAYGKHVHKGALAASLLEAVVWTLMEGKDARRRVEAAATMNALNWGPAMAEAIADASVRDPALRAARLRVLAGRRAEELHVESPADLVRAALEIYFYRYHEILSGLARGEGERLAQEVTGGRRLIEPMPGVGVSLALVKGWLGRAAGEFYEGLRAHLPEDAPLPAPGVCRARLEALGERFQARPLRLAVVTSSIEYEADIVLGEVFSVLREEAARWPVKRELAERFDDPREFYDAVVTASDSSEIRLKPHRDLYSIALHAIGVGPEDFGAVAGFEDSESGVVSIRAAGVGLCVAVPFTDTEGHDFSAAAHVLPGGLPQALLEYNLFIEP